MKVGDYLVCKEKDRIGNNIILVGKKYKILFIHNVSFDGEFEDLIYVNSDFINSNGRIVNEGGVVIHYSSLKNSHSTHRYIGDYFLEVSDVREEKLKELGI